MNQELTIRVTVGDLWEALPLKVATSSSVSAMKQRALSDASIPGNAADYLVKFRGAELRDEAQTLAEVGVPENGAVIILQRRRQAVR